MLPEADVQCPRCHNNVLHSALFAFDQIDYVLCLASGTCVHCVHCVGFVGDLASESVCFLDVIAALTVSSFTSLVSNVFCEGDSRLSYECLESIDP